MPVIENSIYYLISGLFIALSFFFTFGTFYIKKVRKKVEDSTKGDSEPKSNIKISKKEIWIRSIILILLISIGMIVSYFAIPNMYGSILTKIFLFGLGTFSYIVVSVLDVKKGEVFIYELGFTNTLCLFILPIIVNFIFGCSCVAKGMLITFGIYALIKILNYLFNRELSIGGADIDTLAAIVGVTVGVIIAINNREKMPIFVETYFLETLLTTVFFNFSISLLVFFVAKIIKRFSNKKNKLEILSNGQESSSNKEVSTEEAKISDSEEPGNKNKTMSGEKNNKMNFRCLPSFAAVYTFVLFFALFY